MELVYLWVEDYKNIKEQGFNFSPRFECEYKNDELSIIEKNEDEYIKDFFGKNINVTAIVGKNGSGKSRILELLTNNDFNSLFFDEERNIINIHEKFDIFLVNENDNSYLYKNNLNVNKIISKRFNLEENNNLKYQINNLTISFLSELGNINSDIYFSPTGIKLIYEKKIKLEAIRNLEGITITHSTQYDTLDHKKIYVEDLENIKKIFEKKLNFFISKMDFENYLKLREFIFRITRRDAIIFKHFQIEYGDDCTVESVVKSIYDKFLEKHSDENFNRIIGILENMDKESIDMDEIVINYSDNDISEIEILLVNLHRGYFNIEFFLKKENEIIYFNNLSDGEQQILLMFSKIYYPLRTIFKDNDKNIILLMDEPDSFLHPNWQKSFLSYFYSFINNLNFLREKKIHLVFTTHSPFLLSDIPRQNIIFLDKYKKDEDENQKEGNCKVVDGLKQTFGANIHTLLSDSFFMEDGLMGAFAKNKINKIIRFLNGKNRFIDFPINQIEKVINSIGEPFLKQKILDMYNKKFIKEYKDRQKEKIKKQIEDLNSQLKELDNDSDR